MCVAAGIHGSVGAEHFLQHGDTCAVLGQRLFRMRLQRVEQLAKLMFAIGQGGFLHESSPFAGGNVTYFAQKWGRKTQRLAGSIAL